MAFHDLTEHQIAPPEAKSLLGLGSKFIVTPETTTGSLEKNFQRIQRDFYLSVHFASDCDDDLNIWTGTDNDRDNRSKLYVKSKWTPTDLDVPSWAARRIGKFKRQVQKLFKQRRAKSNLLPYQQEMMDLLLNHPELLFPETDKGLGPCAVTYSQYVEDCLKHLCNKDCYRQLTEEEANTAAKALSESIEIWVRRHRKKIGGHAAGFILNHMAENSSNPFGQFYILYKIHKGKKDNAWPTRPVCSDVTSLPHGLGKWINEMLIPIAQRQKSYFKDSFELKRRLDELILPPNAMIFTCDATAMYTNIKTEDALREISKYLREIEDTIKHVDVEVLIEALELVFKSNYFKLGDTFWHQTSGTAMGTPPAPAWATIFFALYEEILIPKWSSTIPFYLRFIDDGIGIWLMDEDPEVAQAQFKQFQQEMDNWFGLQWSFTDLATTADFMDLTISIVNGRIETTLFEKAQNLYLYIPPHSSHPKGVTNGLIMGQVLRIRRLCTHKADADAKIKQFASRLTQRGHKPDDLLPIFTRAEKNAAEYLKRCSTSRNELPHRKSTSSERQLFYHIQFHPEDPPSKEIQRVWRETVSHPEGEPELSSMDNQFKQKVGKSKLVVAYSRPLNLRNRFTVRDIHCRGRAVSEYLVE